MPRYVRSYGRWGMPPLVTYFSASYFSGCKALGEHILPYTTCPMSADFPLSFVHCISHFHSRTCYSSGGSGRNSPFCVEEKEEHETSLVPGCECLCLSHAFQALSQITSSILHFWLWTCLLGTQGSTYSRIPHIPCPLYPSFIAFPVFIHVHSRASNWNSPFCVEEEKRNTRPQLHIIHAHVYSIPKHILKI